MLCLYTTGIVKGKNGGDTYAVYNIQVAETVLSTGAVHKWQTTRRYSDFYDLYIMLCNKVHYVIYCDFHGIQND